MERGAKENIMKFIRKKKGGEHRRLTRKTEEGTTLYSPSDCSFLLFVHSNSKRLPSLEARGGGDSVTIYKCKKQ